MPEVAWGNHDQPQRGQGQQVEQVPGPALILRQTVRVVRTIVSISGPARPVIIVSHGHQRSTRRTSQPSTYPIREGVSSASDDALPGRQGQREQQQGNVSQ